MRAAGALVGLVLARLRNMVEPGISTIEIDGAAEKNDPRRRCAPDLQGL